MNKPIEITNFLRAMPQVPQYSDKNQHYLIANSDPLHYLSDNSQEEQIAPLIAARSFAALHSLTGVGNVVDMITGAGNFDIFIVDDLYHVYGYDFAGTYHTDFGKVYTPSPATAIGDGRIAYFNSELVFSNRTKLYTVASPYTGGWTDITATSGIASSSVPKQLELFLEYLVTSVNGDIWVLDSSWHATLAFSLGANASITKLQNFNDKYIAIAYNLGNTIGNNYIAFWDGVNPEPNYRVKVNGLFQDMYVNQGVLYVMVLENAGQSTLYYLVGTTLRRQQSIQYDYCTLYPSELFAPNNIFFNFRGILGVNLNSKGNLLIGNSDAGATEYIINNAPFTKLINAGGINDYSGGHLFAGAGNAIYYFEETGTTYLDIIYQTQWIPVRNLAGIDIWYDTPPAVTGDAITLTVYGKGENLITSGSQTINCPPITPTSIDTQQRTRVALRDVSTGEEFAGDQVMIKLQTTIGSTGHFRPKITQINLI